MLVVSGVVIDLVHAHYFTALSCSTGRDKGRYVCRLRHDRSATFAVNVGGRGISAIVVWREMFVAICEVKSILDVV